MPINMAEQVCAPILGNSTATLPYLGDAGATAIQTFPQSFGKLGTHWIVLTFLALFCSLLALVLVNMLANFLRNQALIAWTKFELFQMVGTAVIFIFAVVWVSGMCHFNMGFLDVHYDQRNMYEIVDDYFSFLRGVGAVLFGYMMYFSKVITLLQKVTYFSSPLGLGMTDNPLDSLGQLNSVLFFAVGGFITSYLMLDLQFKIMGYMAVASLYYLFPFGIFLRAFQPTRGFGGTLIGISIAFFLFYPITVVFNDYIMRTSALSPAAAQLAHVPDDQAALDQNVQQGKMPDNSNMESSLSSGGDLNDQASLENLVKGVGSGTIWILKPLALYIIAAIVLPVIDFLALVEVTKGLSKLFGEEVDISNLTRLI